jgi:hypothetical protein
MKKIMGKIVLKTVHDFFLGCCFFCVLWLSLVPAAMGAKAGENEILAIGTATIKDGNLAQAKESAISDALTKGVENYLLHRLGSEGVAYNFNRIIYDILPRAKVKVENFNIILEDQTGEEFNVFIKLRVNEKVIDEKLREAGVVVKEGPSIEALYLDITLKGLSSYKQFRVFRDFLRRDVSGVKSVRQTRVRKDAISIAVEFEGDRNSFVERVLNHDNLPFLVKLEPGEEEEILFRIDQFQ